MFERCSGSAEVVLVALLGWFAFSTFSGSRDAKAEVQLSAGIALVLEAQTDGSANAGQLRSEAAGIFESVRADYSRTPSARIAEAYLGSLAMEAGDPQTARSHWESFVSSSSDDALVAEIWMNLIRLDREEGRDEELIDRLQGMLDSRNRPLPEDLLLGELATSLENVGRTAEAREIYQRIVDEFPRSTYAANARRALAEPAASLG